MVAAEHRGQGIGRHVLAAVVALAQRRECTLVGASAPTDGPGAALLAAVGFALVSQGEDSVDVTRAPAGGSARLDRSDSRDQPSRGRAVP